MSVSTEPEVGLRERQKCARRNALVDAAQTLVLAHGLDAVTVEAIASEAGVSTRTFFNYFDSKDEAVLGLFDLRIDPAVGAAFAAGGPTGRPLEDIEILVRSLLSTLAPHQEHRRRTFAILRAEPRLVPQQMAWFEQHEAAIGALFRERQGVLPATVDPTMGCLVTMALVRTAGGAWERSGFAGDPADHVAAAISQIRLLAGDGPAAT